jgi:ribosomal peptide maturation radical SAM protein 1
MAAPRDGCDPRSSYPVVMLVNMPFAAYRQPSLALGLLKAVLAPLAVRVSVLDATLIFAQMISPTLYETISTWQPQDLLGDWIFAAALSGFGGGLAESPATFVDGYLHQVLAGGAPEHGVPYFGKPPVGARLREELLGARQQAGSLLTICLDEIVAAQPLVVGFTSMFHQHAASLALAARVKVRLPQSCVVFGGASCHGPMGEELLNSFPFVDAVAPGEGETAMVDLVERLLDGRSIAGTRGMLTRSGVQAQDRRWAPAPAVLDNLPTPLYDDYFDRLASSRLRGSFSPRLPFETSRGCWWGEKSRCIFCGQASASLGFRRKGAERALAELQELVRRHPGCAVFVTDEILAPNSVDELLPSLGERLPGLSIVYLQVRPDLTKHELRTLAGAGVQRVEVGIESLSTRVLRLMHKGTTALQGVQFLKWAAEAGLDVVWNLLWGLPGEEPSEYAKMAGIVPLLTHLQPPNAVGAFRLDRFSPAFENAEHLGIRDVQPFPAYSFVYNLSPKALRRLAYFFVFRYRQPQQVERYTAPLAEAIDAWKKWHPTSSFTFTDDNERLVLLDTRPGFDPGEATILDGEHRQLYLACDSVRTSRYLAATLADLNGKNQDEQTVEALLAPLVEQGLLLRDGSYYLSLALAAHHPYGQREGAHRGRRA